MPWQAFLPSFLAISCVSCRSSTPSLYPLFPLPADTWAQPSCWLILDCLRAQQSFFQPPTIENYDLLLRSFILCSAVRELERRFPLLPTPPAPEPCHCVLRQSLFCSGPLLEGTLHALGTLCMSREESRKQLMDAKVLGPVVRALEHEQSCEAHTWLCCFGCNEPQAGAQRVDALALGSVENLEFWIGGLVSGMFASRAV